MKVLEFLGLLAPLTVLSLIASLVGVAWIMLFGKDHKELSITRIVKFGLSVSCFAAVCSGVALLFGSSPVLPVLRFVTTPTPSHPLELALSIDRLAVTFVVVTTLLCGTVGAFSRAYLHRDPGHGRFFFLILLFALGMEIIFMATNIEVLFIGWELIGLSSALLISFFFERKSTADNSLKAFWAYRVSDTALLVCSILFTVAGTHSELVSAESAKALPSGLLGVVIPILIVVAAIPKSAQFPFCSWLPRAMEGPTPSSAIFYGGLSVHAGLYLILRFQHQYILPTWWYVFVGVVGALSAWYGSLLSKVQSDVKSLLSFGSITHVGLMFIEVALGLEALAVVHFVGHAFLRSYQILSAGSLVHEGRALAIGRRKPLLQNLLPRRFTETLNALAFDLSLRDGTHPTSLVSRLERLSVRLGLLEQAWAQMLSRGVDLMLGESKNEDQRTASVPVPAPKP